MISQGSEQQRSRDAQDLTGNCSRLKRERGNSAAGLMGVILAMTRYFPSVGLSIETRVRASKCGLLLPQLENGLAGELEMSAPRTARVSRLHQYR